MFILVGDIVDFENAIQFLRNEGKNELEAVLVLYIKVRNATPEIRYIRLTDEAIKVIRESYLSKITKINNRGKNFEEFDPEEFDPHAIPYLDLEKINSDDLKIKELNNKKPSDVENENKLITQDEINKIRYILMRFRNSDGETLGIFSRYKEKKYFEPSKLLKFIRRGNSLTPMGKHDFGLNVDIDLLFFGSKVYIFKRELFMEVFNYTAIYEKNANEVFDYLKNENKDYKIKDIDQLKEDARKKYKFEYYTKLNNIRINGYYKNVSLSQIKEIREGHKLKFSIDEENKEITFSDPEEFVRLYNRDYITDDIGKEKWTAFRKKKS